MSFKDLLAKEKALKQKASSESSNLEVKSNCSSTASSSCDSGSSKK